MKVTRLCRAAAAALALSLPLPAQGNAATVVFDQNLGAVTDPGSSYTAKFSDLPEYNGSTTTGPYAAYMIFDVTGPKPFFTAALGAYDLGATNTSTQFSSTSHIELFSCTLATCGAVTTSSGWSSSNTAPTGSAIAGTQTDFTTTLFLPSPPFQGFFQYAASSAGDLKPGWYYMEIYGAVTGEGDTTVTGQTAIAGIPEGSTWGMLALGFLSIGLFGFTRRRRQPRHAF